MKRFATAILPFIPLVALMAFGYVAPLAINLSGSMHDTSGTFVGLANYTETLTSYYFKDSLLYTLKISLVSTFIAMAVAVITALALRESFIGKKLVLLMFEFNLTVPRMAAAMMIMLLLSQTGLISQICMELGITSSASEFPWFVHDAGGWGIIFGFAWKFFPYIGISTLGVLQGASTEYEQQAAVLGVSAFKRFWHVTLPMIIPATTVASIIVFSAAFGDYELPAILGASTTRALSVTTYTLFTDPVMGDKPQAYVLMVIMMVVLVVVILLYRYLARKVGANDA